jgi:UbiD family decarboxylase
MVDKIKTYRLTRYIDNKRLAQLLGVSYTQFKKMISGEQDIKEVMEQCNEEIATEIKASIYQKAMGYEAQEIEILACYDKDGKAVNTRWGQQITIKITTKHVPADMRAAEMALNKLDPSWAEGGQEVIIYDDVKPDSSEVSRDLESGDTLQGT